MAGKWRHAKHLGGMADGGFEVDARQDGRPPDARQDGRPSAQATERVTDSASASSIASISLLYESADGKLCLFEDASGHLTAVRAARLA